MKLQAIMNRATAKQGTDLQDIARLALDQQARPAALTQLGGCDAPTAADIALHVDLWLVRRRAQALQWIHQAGGTDLTADDLDLVAELLLTACEPAAVTSVGQNGGSSGSHQVSGSNGSGSPAATSRLRRGRSAQT